MHLDDFQKEIVNYSGDKFPCVEADPGAGKTPVIVERVKKLMEDARPESLLVITIQKIMKSTKGNCMSI